MNSSSPLWMSKLSVSRFWFHICVYGRHGYVMKSAGNSSSIIFLSFSSVFNCNGDGSFPAAFSLLLPKALNIWRLKIGLIIREKRMLTCVESILARMGICLKCVCWIHGLLQTAVGEGRPMTQHSSTVSDVSLVFTAEKVRKLNETPW